MCRFVSLLLIRFGARRGIVAPGTEMIAGLGFTPAFILFAAFLGCRGLFILGILTRCFLRLALAVLSSAALGGKRWHLKFGSRFVFIGASCLLGSLFNGSGGRVLVLLFLKRAETFLTSVMLGQNFDPRLIWVVPLARAFKI